jgi:sulfite exporter TauE/SafE
MNKNVGSLDRNIRIIAGVAIIAAGIYYQSWWGAIGAIPLLTGLLGWCPPYSLLGLNTRADKK